MLRLFSFSRFGWATGLVRRLRTLCNDCRLEPESLHFKRELVEERTPACAWSLPRRSTASVEEGEALFEVAKDAHRPFVVRVADSEVRALGTVFSVRLIPTTRIDGDALAVTLIEGQVSVRTAQRSSAAPNDELELVGPCHPPHPCRRRAVPGLRACHRRGRRPADDRQFHAQPAGDPAVEVLTMKFISIALIFTLLAGAQQAGQPAAQATPQAATASSSFRPTRSWWWRR